MAMPTMNTQPFGGMPNAIPEPVDAVDLHAQRIREQLMQKRAQRDLQERAHIHANRPPLQDPEDFAKAVYKKPKGGTRGGQGNVPANGGRITGIPAPGTFKPNEVGPAGRLTPQAVWQRFHPNPLAGVTHGIPPGMSEEEFAQQQQSVRQQQLAAAAARHAAITQMDAARRRGTPSTGYAYGASNSVPGSVDALLGHMNPNVGVGGGTLLMHPPRQEGYGDMPGAIVPLNPALAAKQRLDRQRLRTSLGGRGHAALIEAGRPQLTQDEIDLENWRNGPGRMGSEVRGTLTPEEYKARRDDDLQSVKDRLATELQAKAARTRMASDAGVANTPENIAALVRAG
ncbi:MAG: hypothetical protein KGL39_29275, partial [Patescibacteria group bacterium]|nr:hypothetical protein [Patescibacteria group bacterium]